MYAQYAAIDSTRLIQLNDATDLLEAGAMPVTYFTAYHMLHNVVGVEEGRHALVYAACGGVGTALIQLAKIAKLKIIALERRDEKVQTALQLGADFAFNSSSNWVKAVKEITGGQGVDYIFNPVAGDTMVQDLDALATLGHIVIFGLLAGVGEINLQAEVVKHFTKAPRISYSEIYATYFKDFGLVQQSMENIYTLLEQKKIKPLIHTLPLAEAAKAHEMIETGKVIGKLLLTPHR